MKDLVLNEIYKRIGSRNALAKRLGISRAAVSAWDQVPAGRVKTIAEWTGIPKYLIRPDLFTKND